MHGAGRSGATRRSNASDVALLGAIRRGDAAAIAKFIDRMLPLLLDAARRGKIERSERETLVLEFLDDIVLQLMQMPTPASSPAGFTIRAFWHHLSDRARADAARLRRDVDDCETVGGEQTVAGTCSDYTLRAVTAPDADDSPGNEPSSHVIGAFMAQLTSQCSPEDRHLLVYVSHRVPLRDCAEWLGISYDAAKQRVARLRTRLRAAALRQLATLAPQERAIIVRLLVRSGVLVTASVTPPQTEVSHD